MTQKAGAGDPLFDRAGRQPADQHPFIAGFGILGADIALDVELARLIFQLLGDLLADLLQTTDILVRLNDDLFAGKMRR